VILADRDGSRFAYEGIAEALALGAPKSPVDLRLFAKPETHANRRMGIALARSDTAEHAVERARSAASRVHIRYED